MNNVIATIGLAQLECLNDNVLRYIDNGQFFDKKLQNVEGLTLIPYHKDTEPSYWLYTIQVERRDDFIRMMSANGVAASPLHLRNDNHSVFNAPSGKTPNLDEFISHMYIFHVDGGLQSPIEREWWTLSKRDGNCMIPLYKPYMPDVPLVNEILHSGQLAYGKYGREFENKLSN